jgi:membrane-associated phospholipid phosphatase
VRRILALLLASAFAAASHAAAGEPPATRSPDVYRVDPAVDGAIIAAATAATLVPWLLEDRIIDVRCPCDPAEVPRWERFAIGNESPAADLASNATLAAAAIGPAFWSLVTTRGDPSAFWHDATILAEATLVTGALTTTTKYFVWQRPIPLAYEGAPDYVDEPGSYRAFWSGHTATVAASLTAWAWTHRLRKGPAAWPFLLAAAGTASVAFERIAGGHHFPTDVIVGAIVGGAIGTAVPLLHARDRRGNRIAIVPRRQGVAVAGVF